MEKIKNLHFKRILKELEYVESDFEYRNELVSAADNEFIKSINDFLIGHPEIKEVYDKKVNEKIQKTIEKKIEDLITPEVLEIEESNISELEAPLKENENLKLKKLYREVAKITHPDVVKKKRLNDLYISATNYYNVNDKVGIYRICSELNIDYEIDESDEYLIMDKISGLRKRIEFLESTYTWKWQNTKDEMDKNQILINYIKMRIS